MTAITFPNSPTSGDSHTAGNGVTYVYDGEKWTTVGSYSAGAWTRSGGNVYTTTSTDNVGIGTTSPTSNLEVVENGTHSIVTASSNVSTTALASRFSLGNSVGNARFTINMKGGGGEEAYLGSEGNFPIYFQTNGAERMRIDSSGKVGIGNSSPSSYFGGANDLVVGGSGSGSNGITVVSGSTSAGNLFFADGTGTGDHSRGIIQYTHSDDSLRFSTASVERMRIDSSGSLLVGRTSAYNASPGEVAAFQGDRHGVVIFQTANANYTCLNLRNTYANNGGNNVSGNMITFLDQGGTERGKIAMNGNSTSYISNSDYRLKENVIGLSDGITRVKQLQPKRFNFIGFADTIVDGFLAHEAQTVVPEAVTGTHNEVDDNNNPVYQGIDQSKLVPLLTAALQEAIAKIETLEQRLADAGL